MAQKIEFQAAGTPNATTRQAKVWKDREIIVQLDTRDLYIGDGVTAGGQFFASAGSTLTGASNVGTAGIGVFDGVNSGTLEFRNINAQSSKILVTLNAGDKEIRIDLDPSQVNTSLLNNDAGFQTSAQVSAAISAHEAAGDPHPQYATNAEATTIAQGEVTTHTAAGDPHPQYDTSAEAQAKADAAQNFAVQRGNHTGTQPANTISNFATTVRSTILTGLSFSNVAVLASDTVLSAIGKLQGQLNARVFGTEFEDFINTSQVNFNGSIGLRRSYTTASKPAGRYRVAVQIQFEPASTGNNDFFELRVDGTNISLQQEAEPKDTGGDIRDTRYLVGYYQHPSTGTFDIEIWGGNNTGTTELNGSIAEVWRVS